MPNSSTRATLSDVAQQEYNASHIALSYVNAAETKKAKGLLKGHTPSSGYLCIKHKDMK